MAVNKVVYDGKTLIDLTADTVIPEKLAKGYTAHDMSGKAIEGTMESSSGSYTEVDTLPTSNIGADAIYATTEQRDVEVWYVSSGACSTMGNTIISVTGVTPSITYYLVDALPNDPTASDLSSFRTIYVYVYNDTPYVYGNMGSGSTWLTVVQIYQAQGVTTVYRGYVENIAYTTQDGLYITYNKKDIIAVSNINEDKAVYQYNGDGNGWKNYYDLFLNRIGGSISGNIDIPYGVSRIARYAFAGSGITAVNIPNSVTLIGRYAFYDCSSLTSVEIPNSVTLIGRYAFRSCSSLTSVEIPNSVTSIGYYAFADCYSLTSVVIGDSVTSIGDWAFYNCKILTSVVIGDSVTSIGYYAFYDCESLTSVEIPNSVTSIGDYAFASTAITDIHYSGTKEQWNAISKQSAWDIFMGEYTVHCTDGDIAKS